MKKTFFVVAATIVVLGGRAFAQDDTAPVPNKARAKESQIEKSDVIAPSRMEKEIALVKIAKLDTQIDLAKLAYQKARSEKVRQLASKLEAVHLAERNRLQEWAKATVVSTPLDTEAEKPRGVTEPDSNSSKSTLPPDITPRRGQGSQDPSFGGKPDAGSLDEYNRKTVNRKGDSEEDKAWLKEKLQEQSTPTVTDKKREVEKPATESSTADRRPMLSSPWVAIQERIEARRLKNIRQELAEIGGAEFDERYLRWVVSSHQDFIDSDAAYVDHFSAGPRQLLINQAKQNKNHLAEAEEMLAEIATLPKLTPPHDEPQK